MAIRAEHSEPEPHGQLSALPELRHCGRFAFQGQPAQQSVCSSVHHPPGQELPSRRCQQMHCRKWLLENASGEMSSQVFPRLFRILAVSKETGGGQVLLV